MLKLGKISDKRIILINGEGLAVYALHHQQLTLVARFTDEDSGYSEFEQYLAENSKSPVTVLVDSPTEDFIVENVAHVSAFDRNTFLNRKADQHFRGVEYRSAKVIGRETEGRRDDRVLFSAIAKNSTIDPWLRVLLARKIPIKGITTPAYALTRVAKDFSMLTQERVMLVNWESSGIRQTYMVDGKTRFSRLTPPLNGSREQVPQEIIGSCSQSREYLERIGLIEYGEKVDVHIITPHLNDEDFEDLSNTAGFGLVMHHNSIDMMQVDHFDGPQHDITATLLCLDWGVRKGDLANIYGNSQVRRFHTLTQVRKLVAFLCLAMLILTTMVSTPLLLDGIDRSYRTTDLERQILPVQALYSSLLNEFPETPIPSEAMELAVRTHDVIHEQAKSPFEPLIAISDVLSRHRSIALHAFDWRLESANPSQQLTMGLLTENTVISLEIYGVLVETVSVQDSDSRLRLFMTALEAIEGFTVEAIVLPVEPDPFSAVNTVIDDRAVDAAFALSIRIGS